METIFILLLKFLKWISPETFQRSALNLIKFNARIPMNHSDKEQMAKIGLDTRPYTTFGSMLPKENQEYVFLFVVPPIDLRPKKYRHF